jgi:hypothetical protein
MKHFDIKIKYFLLMKYGQAITFSYQDYYFFVDECG